MEWHEILAWIVVAAAFAVAIVWIVRAIICPSSRCQSCDKHCVLKRKTEENTKK